MSIYCMYLCGLQGISFGSLVVGSTTTKVFHYLCHYSLDNAIQSIYIVLNMKHKPQHKGGNMKRVIIRNHDTGAIDILSGIPDGKSPASIVEIWQKKTIHYQVHGTLPSITWKVSDADTLVSAMIESARL